MGVIPTSIREAKALSEVRLEEYANYSSSKNQSCDQLLLDIKDIELRLSALPNIILLASGSFSIAPIGTTLLMMNNPSTIKYSPRMKAEAQQKVLAEILVQKKSQANSQLCYEQAKAEETTKKNIELSNLIVDSNIKAEGQIIPETTKKSNKTLLIGGGILLVALGLILMFSSKKK